jgi:hypothetical protein
MKASGLSVNRAPPAKVTLIWFIYWLLPVLRISLIYIFPIPNPYTEKFLDWREYKSAPGLEFF